MQIALGAGLAVAILGAAVVLSPLLRLVPDVVSAQPESPVVQAATPQAFTPAPDETGPADSSVADAPAVDPPAALVPPLIDVVRIAPDGSGIVAGQAPAGTTVSVMLGDAMMTEVVADPSGNFVAFVTVPPSDQPRILSLIADAAGRAVASEATVIIAPNPPVAAQTAVAAPQTAPDAAPDAAEPTVEIASAEPPLAVEPAASESGQDTITDPAAVVAPAPQPVEPATTTGVAEAIAIPPVAIPPTASPGSDTQSVAANATANDVATDLPDPILAETAQPADPAAPAQTLASPATAPAPVAPVTPVTPAAIAPPAVAPVAQPDTPPVVLDSVAALQPPGPDVAGANTPGIAPVLRVDSEGVRVLQPAIAPGAAPEVLATVALDAIAYDAAGDVQLSGRAAGGGTVRIYVDNRPVVDVPVGADGQWASGLPDVPTGVYTMRVDQLDAGGAVISRIETPFLREERATIAAAMVDQTEAADFTVAVKIVQPGATLWAIARERYGDGVLYVQVFEANRDRIRNPDLIYPGQVFVLPELSADVAQP